MKGLFYKLLIVLAIGFSACSLKNKSENGSVVFEDGSVAELKTTLNFNSTEHDFGQVKEGEKVVCKYEVVNTGKVDLLIHEVRVSCGCTTPKYDKKPIRPGRSATIEVTFDTSRRSGIQHKDVTVITNTEPARTVLTFTCEVIPNQ